MYMIVQIKAGFQCSAVLTNQNEILFWGNGGTDIGQFISPQKVYMEDVRFVDISLNKSGSAEPFLGAIDREGGLYSWGSN